MNVSASECVCLPMHNDIVSIWEQSMQWQTSIQLSVKGSKADMWANVLARQSVASGRV